MAALNIQGNSATSAVQPHNLELVMCFVHTHQGWYDVKLEVWKAENFLSLPPFPHKVQPVPFKSRGHLGTVKQFEKEHPSLPLICSWWGNAINRIYPEIPWYNSYFICFKRYLLVRPAATHTPAKHWQAVILLSDCTGVVSAALFTPHLPFSCCGSHADGTWCYLRGERVARGVY